jgi:hypothetical protein
MKTVIKEMRALSIIQPLATAIISKGKNIENRRWNTKMRGYFAIHASQKIDRKRFDYLLDEYGIRLSPEATPFGVVVGLAECVDVITKKEVTRNTKKWFKGEYGFVLKNVISIKKPVPVKGGLGFWRLKGRALHAVLDQLNSLQIKIIASNTLGIIDKV